MEVIVAKSAGFCFGVKRAVDNVYDAIKNNNDTKKIYTFGPIIHNEEVVKDLESKGVTVIESKEQLKALDEGIVVIRSHGVEKEIYDIIQEKGLEIIDATCPFVKKIHKIVMEEQKKGRFIIIIGNDNHPEVEGIKGWMKSDYAVVSCEEDIEKIDLKRNKKISIVSQTTFNYNKFNNLVEIIRKKGYDIIVLNTICGATEERQTEAKAIAAVSDAMIVIGGSHSSNTQKLYDICNNECNLTYYIQTIDDLDLSKLQSVSCVGITAGASTPNNIIEEVHTNVRIKF